MISSAFRTKSVLLNASKLNFVYSLLNDPLMVTHLKNNIFTNARIGRRSFTKSSFNNSLDFRTNLGTIVGLDYDEVEIVPEEPTVDNKKHLRKTKKKKSISNELSNLKKKDEQSVFNESELENSNSKYNEIESENSGNLKYISSKEAINNLRKEMLSIQTKNKRFRNEKIVLEGRRLIHDALYAGLKPHMIFFTRISLLKDLNLPSDIKLCLVPYKNLKLWTSVVTSSGLLGVFEKPTEIKPNKNGNILPITVICDQIRDPGNMGSILRVAVSAGCKKILLTEGCVNIWDSKVLRSGGGAHFRHLPLVRLSWKDIENEVSEEDKVILADNEQCGSRESEDGLDGPESFSKIKSNLCNQFPLLQYDNVAYAKESIVVVIGGETKGLSEDAYLFAKRKQGVRTFIPMSNLMESLNSAVALGILLYEIRRQMEDISRRRLVNFV